MLKVSLHLILVLFLMTACTGNISKDGLMPSVPYAIPDGTLNDEKVVAVHEKPTFVVQKKPEEEGQDTDKTTPTFNGQNVGGIEITQIHLPYMPPVNAISGNHRVIAVGDNRGVAIYDAATQKELMQIDVSLPDCQYGWDRYLTLDHTGQFLGMTTLAGVEVWQVGGGKIYETPYFHGELLNRLTCGLDIPQIALSPDGKYLAESGLGIGEDEYRDYFRVVDVINNEVVYFWDGDDEQPHGRLYEYPGLGFSTDGKMLHTFVPAQDETVNDGLNGTFHFWETESWNEIPHGSHLIPESFESGSLLYPRNADAGVEIINKLTDVSLVKIEEPGCAENTPCGVIFSPDGKSVALLKRSGELVYKRETLIDEISIYAIDNAKEIRSFPVHLRQKSAIAIEDNAVPVLLESTPEDRSSWWTNTAYIDGFAYGAEGNIIFIPDDNDIFTKTHPYTGTCTIHISENTITCEQGIFIHNQAVKLTVDVIENGFGINTENDKLAQVRFPPGSEFDEWQIRLKSYNPQSGVGYFCLDRNYREETCIVMDFLKNEILEEQIDLFGFIYSPEYELAAFINRDSKELMIFYEDSQSIRKMRSYRAIAYPVKPVLAPDGIRAYYFVNNTDIGNLYLEEISLVDGSVIQRHGIEIEDDVRINALEVYEENGLVVTGDALGGISFHELLSGEVLHNFKVSTDGIVDLKFTRDGRQLLVMDTSGKISVLSIK